VSYRRLIPLLLGTSLCLVLVLLLLDSGQDSPSLREGPLPRSASGESEPNPLREIRDAQRRNARLLRVLEEKLEAAPGPPPAKNPPLNRMPGAVEVRWKERLHEAEEELVVQEVVRVRLKLLKQARQLRMRLSVLKPDDRQFPVTQRRLRGTEDALARLADVRTLDDLVHLTSRLP